MRTTPPLPVAPGASAAAASSAAPITPSIAAASRSRIRTRCTLFPVSLPVLPQAAIIEQAALLSTTLRRARAMMCVMSSPERGPRETGRLPVGGGRELHWERWGTAGGRPAVALHGGPGAGCSPWWATLFDLELDDVLLFDQRGCGRSTPNAGVTTAALEHNTTADLVGDIEQLRVLCGLDRWTVVVVVGLDARAGLCAAPPGAGRRTRALLRRHDQRRGGRVGDARDRRDLPRRVEPLCDVVPAAQRAGNLAAAYARMLCDPDPAVCAEAAERWCAWDDRAATPPGQTPHDRRFEDPRFRLCWARIVTHYWSNAAFLPPGALLSGMARLAAVPGRLVHGAADLGSPPATARALAARWPGAGLRVVDAGHGGPTVAAAVRESLAELAVSAT